MAIMVEQLPSGLWRILDEYIFEEALFETREKAEDTFQRFETYIEDAERNRLIEESEMET